MNRTQELDNHWAGRWYCNTCQFYTAQPEWHAGHQLVNLLPVPRLHELDLAALDKQFREFLYTQNLDDLCVPKQLSSDLIVIVTAWLRGQF